MVLNPMKHVLRGFLNGFKTFLEKHVSIEVHNNYCFCERWKIAYEKNIGYQISMHEINIHTNEKCFIS